jgi:hypothetical protein
VAVVLTLEFVLGPLRKSSQNWGTQMSLQPN